MKAIIFVPDWKHSVVDSAICLHADPDLLPHLDGESTIYVSDTQNSRAFPRVPGVYQCDVEPIPDELGVCIWSNFILLSAMPGQKRCYPCKFHKAMCAGHTGSIYHPVHQHYCQHDAVKSENCGDGRLIDVGDVMPSWCPGSYMWEWCPESYDSLPVCPVCGDKRQNTLPDGPTENKQDEVAR